MECLCIWKCFCFNVYFTHNIIVLFQNDWIVLFCVAHGISTTWALMWYRYNTISNHQASELERVNCIIIYVILCIVKTIPKNWIEVFVPRTRLVGIAFHSYDQIQAEESFPSKANVDDGDKIATRCKRDGLLWDYLCRIVFTPIIHGTRSICYVCSSLITSQSLHSSDSLEGPAVTICHAPATSQKWGGCFPEGIEKIFF